MIMNILNDFFMTYKKKRTQQLIVETLYIIYRTIVSADRHKL